VSCVVTNEEKVLYVNMHWSVTLSIVKDAMQLEILLLEKCAKAPQSPRCTDDCASVLPLLVSRF